MYKTVKHLTIFGIGLGASAVVGWLFLREKRSGRSITGEVRNVDESNSSQTPIPEIVLPLDAIDDKEPAPPDRTPDDLTRIKDIGPRFAEALRRAGISTFSELAQETPESLAERMSPYVSVRPQRIRDKDWIGQANALSLS